MVLYVPPTYACKLSGETKDQQNSLLYARTKQLAYMPYNTIDIQAY